MKPDTQKCKHKTMEVQTCARVYARCMEKCHTQAFSSTSSPLPALSLRASSCTASRMVCRSLPSTSLHHNLPVPCSKSSAVHLEEHLTSYISYVLPLGYATLPSCIHEHKLFSCAKHCMCLRVPVWLAHHVLWHVDTELTHIFIQRQDVA